MTLHFDRESERADRIAKRERRLVYVGGMRACVALAAFAASIAFVIGADGPVGSPNTVRGLVAGAAAAAPFLMLAAWGLSWREPKVAPYTFIARNGDHEQTLVRECVDDYVAIETALTGLQGEGSIIRVGRGPPGTALVLGEWSVVDGRADWRPLQPEWTFYRNPRARAV